MADDGSGGLSIPNSDNWSEWTFEQTLKALTSEGSDLHTPAKAAWFTWNPNPSPGGGDWWQYHAWDKAYFGVNLNTDAINAWATAVNAIDEMMPDVARGKRGSMDSWTLTHLSYELNDMATYFQNTGGGFDQWASRLNSDDDGFRGKAAFLIYWRLKVQGDGLKDTYEQLYSRHGKPMWVSIADAAQALQVYNSTVSRSWQIAMGYNIRNWVTDQIRTMSDRLNAYLQSMGLYKGTPQYILDGMVHDHGREYAENFIRETLANSDWGDLTQESTWTSMSDQVTQKVLNNLKGFLDGPAQTAMAALAPKYVMATSSLIEITAPPPETAPKPDPGDGGDGDNKDLPPPPDGGGGNDNKDLPPPPDGGGGNDKLNIPPPDGGGGGGGGDGLNLPPADGGGGDGGLDLPNGGGGDGGLDLPNGDGGSGGLDLANGGGGPGGPNELNAPGGDPAFDLANGGGGPNGFDPAGGGGGGGGGGGPLGDGGGGFVPGLVPPGGGGVDGGGGPNGKNGVGPGSDGAFDENGLGNHLATPPDGGGGDGFSIVPSDSGASSTHLPPGVNGGGPDGSNGFGTSPNGVNGPDGGLDIGPGGFGSDPAKGFGSGGNLFGTNGGAGNPLGGPGGLDGNGTNGLNGTSGLLNNGSGTPGANGTSGTPGDGGGGVPFFPPMMGGGGGGAPGEKPQERERQTWLLEDEEIWGTRVDVRSGAIGRLDEEEEIEEIPLAGPTRRQRRLETPRRPRPDEKPDTERTTTSGEEVTGSA
ncbi:hypothetical protein [Actinoallomurus sp. CA-142502]|uniref:hypothetical protein n=1 Tax=Actinoallomurus sp. CA-142502 TaxID=3239885 RepID=UPI003D8BD00D